jgi:hypothetical protein
MQFKSASPATLKGENEKKAPTCKSMGDLEEGRRRND